MSGATVWLVLDRAPAPVATPRAESPRPVRDSLAARSPALSAPLSAQQVFELVSPSVLVVLAAGDERAGLGSGVVTERGVVVTNRHVIEGARQLHVGSGEHQWLVANAVLDTNLDLARLEVPGLSAPAVQVRDSASLKVGERVYAIGAPRGLQLTLSEGLVSGVREALGLKLIQTTAAISRGSSGGGLFDERGRLVGITTLKMLGGESLNFALPADRAREIRGPRLLVAENWTPPPRPGPATSAPMAATDPGTSDVDRLRRQGVASYESGVRSIAVQVDALDARWQQYVDGCRGGAHRSYADGRPWFALWDGSDTPQSGESGSCRAALEQLTTFAQRARAAMEQAEDAARQTWVYPGARSEIRRRYRMDWSGW